LNKRLHHFAAGPVDLEIILLVDGEAWMREARTTRKKVKLLPQENHEQM
jgi:hypothetical protein